MAISTTNKYDDFAKTCSIVANLYRLDLDIMLIYFIYTVKMFI